MSDTAATMVAYGLSFAVLAGYAMGVVYRLVRERRRMRGMTPPGDARGERKNTVLTEVKSGSSVKAS
ncbi:MAG: hypothetical protein IT434_13530 [Phycisphaerales bacterium]|jgi:hypothetical protein|nr:hypothetical protein [Phycisphaerales bacterium]